MVSQFSILINHLILNSVEEPLKREPFKVCSYTGNIFATSLAYFFLGKAKCIKIT